MTKAANISSIEQATELSWADWLKFLAEIKAKELSHREIADQVHKKLDSKLENAGWWAQGVAVAYEQHIGRRKPGQRSDGSYETAATKVTGSSMDDAMDKWLHFVGKKQEFNHVSFVGTPSQTQTTKRRHWAVNLTDGSRVSADTNLRSYGKAMISITHSKLSSQSSQAKWHSYWHSVLKTLLSL